MTPMKTDNSTQDTEYHAVITGDVVNSRAMKNANEWQRKLKSKLTEYGSSPKDWQIYRGDSFQLILEAKRNYIKASISLKSVMKSIKGLDLRIAIGIGKISSQSDNVTESTGEVFENSGALFDSLKKRKLAIKTPWVEIDKQINLYLELSSIIIDGWSPATAEVVTQSMSMPNAKQSEIAESINIPQSRVSERLDNANYATIMQMAEYCHAEIQHKIDSGAHVK